MGTQWTYSIIHSLLLLLLPPNLTYWLRFQQLHTVTGTVLVTAHAINMWFLNENKHYIYRP